MGLQIKIHIFRDEVIDAKNNSEASSDFDASTKETKKNVTLQATDDAGNVFFITKWISISNSKSDDDYVKEAYDASKSEIDTWQASNSNIGKTFNPTTGKME